MPIFYLLRYNQHNIHLVRHRHLWPGSEGYTELPPSLLLSLTVVTLLTDFNPENGSTAYVPGSHIHPSYPHNKEEFFKRAIQVDK